MSANPLADATDHAGAPAFRAVLALVEFRLASARADLETAAPEKILFAQGKVRALRDLAQDLSGRKP
ncbi:MAG: hypothetical protein EOL90_05085 [Spartobacteria bacterium]|nr:hypothetical protein [Spartobacteria bacterium]